MSYIGENLLPGSIGHFFIILSFVASLVATFGYYKSVNAATDTDAAVWKKLARISFIIEAAAVFIIFATLFYILYNHLFEYKYAWQHTSRSLEPKYLFSAFWEGQEGSTLLWSFWHCVLGLIIICKHKQWEAPVMAVISLAQVILAALVIGIHFGDYFIGANPFVLLRESGLFDNAPAMHLDFDLSQPVKPDYLASIKDGNDLNPLLQNYWMAIHPPVLFLGFASTIVPFAFALAGLWTKRTKEWVHPTLPWALFSVGILGLGIMMGAKWAYESLNFGGYWAWDPVENASLVPWLIMVSGVHTLLIYKHSGYSLRSTFLFFVLSFIFILYSTFLTKSGILGESSVHAFTDNGLNGQLFSLMFIFIWLSPWMAATSKQTRYLIAAIGAALLIATYFLSDYIPGLGMFTLLAGIIWFVVLLNKQIPASQKEESASSREFWMFIGSLVFFLSALIITFQTSLPVFNKLFGGQMASPENHEFAYNQIQVLVAIIVAILSAIAQYLKYKSTTSSFFIKKIAVPTIISAAIATFVLLVIKVNYTKEGLGFLINIWIALVASIYAVIANLSYMWIGLKGNLKNSGGSIAHVGFGMVLVGILLSSGKKEVLSINTSGIATSFGKDSKEKSGENLTLVKDIAMTMGDYKVTYSGDSVHPKKPTQRYFKIDFKSDKESFTLWPNSFINYKDNAGLMSNPDAKHYWNHDVFTYISSMYNAKDDKQADTTKFTNHIKAIGDTIFYSKGFMLLEKLVSKDNLPGETFQKTDVGYTASVKVQTLNGPSYQSELLLVKNAKEALYRSQDTVISQSLILTLNDVKDGKADIGVKESNAILEYVTLKAYKFPYINILWLGVVVTILGTFISMFKRFGRSNNRMRSV